MNRMEFIHKIQNLKGAHFITIFYETPLRMNKFSNQKNPDGSKIPNPFLDRIIKKCKVNGQINFNYENAVNNRREKESLNPTFKSKGLNWSNASKGKNNSIILKDNVYYLQFRILKYLENELIDKKTGKPISKFELLDFLPPGKSDSTNYNQGVKDDIKVITIKVDNIKKITINKTSHIFENIRKQIRKILLEMKGNVI